MLNDEQIRMNAKAKPGRGADKEPPDLQQFFAHTGERDWELLYTGECEEDCERCRTQEPKHGHLNKVAWWGSKFAAEMYPAGSGESERAAAWGRLLGLVHDLGKFSPEFQARLRGERESVDHSTAGAQVVNERIPGFGQLAAYLIAGHHAGLADWSQNGTDGDLKQRLNKSLPDWETSAPSGLLENLKLPEPPVPAGDADGAAFFARMLFSCLVDADFLATEAFMNPQQVGQRVLWPNDVLPRMWTALDKRFQSFGPAENNVNRQREMVRDACLSAASREPGLFTLTVPTGGGKTLSSLAFAVRHAMKFNLRRVIYVIPFTSIIEQNAAEFRRVFESLSEEIGQDIVLEHHSNYESDKERQDDEKPVWQLSAENWNAPLVVTTNVQFFESHYANKTSRCRKLHNVARSVIIFDEIQSLPVEFLHPCLKLLEQLTEQAGCSAVLCTATQPALAIREGEFPIGLKLSPNREIIPNREALYRDLRRVTLRNEAEPVSDEELASRLRGFERVLCIVNTKAHATNLYNVLGADDPSNMHLSAQMCPAHRRVALAEVKRREEVGEPCRLIATTVVEAGVDVDFPTVFRSETGLDSFAQAAGRCNRHGHYDPNDCTAVYFRSADVKIPGFLLQNVNAADQVIPDHEDLLGLEAIESYFCMYYFLRGKPFHWDKHEVLQNFKINGRSGTPFLYNFKQAARDFRLIADTQRPVIIDPKPGLWEGMNEEKSGTVHDLVEELRNRDRYGLFPPPEAHRKLQRYTVQIPQSIWNSAVQNGDIQDLCNGFPVLTHPENHYDKNLGLQLNASRTDAFMI